MQDVRNPVMFDLLREWEAVCQKLDIKKHLTPDNSGLYLYSGHTSLFKSRRYIFDSVSYS